MTRLWAQGDPIAIQVEADPSTDEPISAFTWQGHVHQVMGIAKRWRVDEGWWRRRIWREYFKLYTHSGLLVVVYNDLLINRWYLQRLYD